MIPAKISFARSVSGPSPAESRNRTNVFLMTNTLETGGSERQFVTLAQALPRDEFDIHLGCLKRIGPFLGEMPSIVEFDLGGSFFALQAQRARLRLARQLRRRRISVAHAFDFYSNLMLIPTARLARVPVVIGSHRQLGDLLTPRQFTAQMMAFRWCDKVVCNSRAAANILMARNLSEEKIAVIPNALPPQAFASAAPAFPRHPSVIRVGMIARMNHAVKNHAGLLRVAARLAEKYLGVEYILAGDGPLRESLEKMADRLGIRSSVKFLGDRQDIPSVLTSIDISILPSLSESLSNTIMESMAVGKPVIAYRVGGNSELVEHGQTGLLVSVNDEEGLADTLGSLLSNPSMREAWGRNARKFALENFGADKVRAQYESLYSNLLAEKGFRAKRQSRVSLQGKTNTCAVRVAIVAPTMRYVGGQAVQARLLVDHWKDDDRVHASFIPIDPTFPRLLAWVQKVPCLRTVLRTPIYIATLWKGMRDIDVAHIFSASYWSFLLAPGPAWAVARLRGKKVLINYRSGEARDHLQRWRTARAILQRSDCLVVPSAYLVDVFKDFGLEAEAVPNFVDVQQFQYRPRRPLRPWLICTRGFEPYYSVELVVRAFAKVKKEFPSARFWLVGKGSQEKAIREYVRSEKLTDVEFTGPIPPDQIHRFYDQADIFVNASWLDNMPVSILEAFASGTPVISTAPEGIRYLVEHERTGLLCEPGDWQALAENIIRLLRDQALAERLAKNAFDESQRYRWEVVGDKWLQIYGSLKNTHIHNDAKMLARSHREAPAVSDKGDLMEACGGEALGDRDCRDGFKL
ncbi:MAG TPA: glycosyltransferase family 4 protein [Terriglobia bacterium]|nr:glycosyltransferase family 4 protein [Terriglobia bacterium]